MAPDETPTLEATLRRLEGAYSTATIRAYRADFQAFQTHCETMGLPSLPADPIAVAEFVDRLSGSGLSSASIRRAVGGIASIHRLNRLTDPTKDPDVVLAMRRMHRILGRAARQAQAIQTQTLEQLLSVCDESLRGYRNRALLLTAYDMLGRRSEVVALQVSDLRPPKVLIRRSKTDPAGLGRWVTLSPRCIDAIHAWLSVAGIASGALFRGIQGSGQLNDALTAGQLNRILKRLARKAGIPPTHISGHSLRIGAAQDLLEKGASLPAIMHRGRWSKTDTVMRYLESSEAPIDPES
jgi:integrase